MYHEPKWGKLSSSEELAALRQAYEGGASVKELAQKHGVVPQFIYVRLRQANAQLRGHDKVRKKPRYK